MGKYIESDEITGKLIVFWGFILISKASGGLFQLQIKKSLKKNILTFNFIPIRFSSSSTNSYYYIN